MNRCIAIVATLLAGIAIACPAVAASVDYDFDVTLNPATRLLTASGTVTLPAGEATALALSDRFDQASAFIGDQRLAQAPIRYRLRGWRVPASTEPRVVTVYWQGTLEPLESGQDHRATLDASKPVSDPRGSFLPARSVWYPQPSGSGLATHHVTLRLPPGQRGLVAGELMEERDDVSGYRARYSFDEPGEGIDLIAGPYRVDERIFTAANGRPLRLRTWFFDGMDDLADGYLDAVQDYIA
ncbi:MAG: hypothetical protein KIT73_19735, partial [Burkholderiales bacterium]|nr:hypothetical protein [Burkholderiales bacterium]